MTIVYIKMVAWVVTMFVVGFLFIGCTVSSNADNSSSSTTPVLTCDDVSPKYPYYTKVDFTLPDGKKDEKCDGNIVAYTINDCNVLLGTASVSYQIQVGKCEGKDSYSKDLVWLDESDLSQGK